MADVNDSLFGDVVSIAIATDLDTPVYKDIVCSQGDIVLDGTTEGATTVVTRCGVLKTPGRAGYQVTGSGVANTTLTSGEMSINELAVLFQSKTQFLTRIQHSTPANYFRKVTGVLSSFRETSSAEGIVAFDFTIDVSGDVDFTV